MSNCSFGAIKCLMAVRSAMLGLLSICCTYWASCLDQTKSCFTVAIMFLRQGSPKTVLFDNNTQNGVR